MATQMLKRTDEHFPGDWPAFVDDEGVQLVRRLWVAGDPTVLTGQPAVTVTGSRAATAYGLQIAGDLGAEFAAAGATVWTTSALGIDSAAAQGAIAAGGRVVLVAPGPVENPHPAVTRALVSTVVDRGGAVISEHPTPEPDVDRWVPTRKAFTRRNEILGAVTVATVIVEASLRSSARWIGESAYLAGKLVHAVPGPVTSAASRGCHDLIATRQARLVTSANEVLQRIGG